MCQRTNRSNNFPDQSQLDILLNLYGSRENAMLAWRQHGAKALQPAPLGNRPATPPRTGGGVTDPS